MHCCVFTSTIVTRTTVILRYTYIGCLVISRLGVFKSTPKPQAKGMILVGFLIIYIQRSYKFNVQGSVHRKYIPFDIFPKRCNITQFIYF